MKTLYLECRMGASGDMLMGAMSELVDQKAFVEQMNALGIPGVTLSAVPSSKCSITGTHMKVAINGAEEISDDASDTAVFTYQLDHISDEQMPHLMEHLQQIQGISSIRLKDHILTFQCSHDAQMQNEQKIRETLQAHEPEAELIYLGHRHLAEGHHNAVNIVKISEMINHLDLPEIVRKDAAAVYQLIADAESHVHGMPVNEIHFHEVGTLDALADVVGCCLLIYMIHPDRIIASPVAVGNGMVRCAHGILPVPAPAVAYLLKGIPTYSGMIQGELCTPTGAGLLKHFVSSFDSQPVMSVEKIGYGMGTKDFPAANCLRAFLGESEDTGEVSELICNLDDISGEEVGHAIDVLLENGALDVYTTPVQMKKNRPGIVFTCMCRSDDSEKMSRLMFCHLSTLGIREYRCFRRTLKQTLLEKHTSQGVVHVKHSEGYGTVREKIEYEDLRKISEEKDISIAQARELVEREIKR